VHVVDAIVHKVYKVIKEYKEYVLDIE